MSLISMTGFAESHGAHETLRWRWEVKSVNGKGLDLRLRTPPGFDGLELPARTLAGERFKRGNLQASLTPEPQDGVRGLRIDTAALAAAIRIAKEIERDGGLAPATADGILSLKGVIVQDEAAALDQAQRGARDAAILESLARAFDQLQTARKNEGVKLSDILHGQIGDIANLTQQAASIAATQPQAFHDRIFAQAKDLLQGGQLSEERLAQEVALLATRADIREELDRLKAHVEEARTLMKSGEAVGRKLDFLAQEFNREANTLCSKSSDIALTRVGLALKATIDQFREQAQNVE